MYCFVKNFVIYSLIVIAVERENRCMSQLVMIIDDSATVRKIIEVSLKREGFMCAGYPDGIEALRALAEKRHPIPELVLLDIGLPKMDGYNIARYLKAKPQFREMVIVMLSERQGVMDRLKGRLAGAQDYMTKPFRTEDVLSMVRSHLNTLTTI